MIEYLTMHLWQIWAIVAVICLILELTAGDFFIICFSIGAVFACLTDALGGGIILQLIVFAVFTLASLFFVRPFAVRFLHKGETVKADSFGRVQIDGDIWKAVTNEQNDIPEGTNVRVISRESTIITVETIN